MTVHDTRRIGIGLCVAMLALSSMHAFGQNLIRNGGFESGDFAFWTVTRQSSPSAFGVDSDDPYEGNYSAFFGGTQPYDSIAQTIATQPGASYRVSFFISSEFSSFDSASFVAHFGDKEIFAISNADPNFTYREFDFDETTSSFSTILTFSAYNRAWYYDLDDISVFQTAAAIPEPSTYELLALGFFMAAAVKSRRDSRAGL